MDGIALKFLVPFRTEDPDMNPHSYTHLLFDKDAKNIR
jgi:hypothetical protein